MTRLLYMGPKILDLLPSASQTLAKMELANPLK